MNTLALKRARISARTPDPENGRIVRDPRSRDAIGLLEGAAADAVEALLPAPTPDDRNRAFFAAITEAQRFGITSVQLLLHGGGHRREIGQLAGA